MDQGELTTKEDISIAVGVIGAAIGLVSILPVGLLYRGLIFGVILELVVIGIIYKRQERLKENYSKRIEFIDGSIGGERIGNILEQANETIKVTHFTVREPNSNYDRTMRSLVNQGININRVVYFRSEEEVVESDDDYEWIRGLKNENHDNVELRLIPRPDGNRKLIGRDIPPVPLRRDILVIGSKLAILDLPRKGSQSRNTDFPNAMIVRGENAEYFETLFDKYWDGSTYLTLDDIPDYS